MSRPRSLPAERRDAGVTLLELVVALALFAMVALIGMQALRLSLRYQEDLARVSQEQSELAFALGLLRHDLEAALQLAPERRAGKDSLPLLIAGVPALDDPAQTRLEEVIWQYDSAAGHLLRRVPDEPDQRLLGNISAFDVALLTKDGWERLQPGIETPRAYEVRLTTAQGPLRLVVVK